MVIKFGTDGWRGIIGDDFTFRNVRICAQAIANYVHQSNLTSRGIVVGYDTRFGSSYFAEAAAKVIASNGIKTFLCNRPTPTPVVSYYTVHRQAAGASIITASHNPAQWNGIKYKPEYGGSASPEVVATLEEQIAKISGSNLYQGSHSRQTQSTAIVQNVDPKPVYLKHISKFVDLNAITASGITIITDAMFGAGGGYWPRLLVSGTTRVTELNSQHNPNFPGITQPEPLAHNLRRLSSTIVRKKADVGLALDGDADRLGLMDENGSFITTLQTFALLCLYYLEVLGKRGPIVRSITMTSMVDRLGEIFGVPVYDTPVGFKYLGPVMMNEHALLAGEESGGYAFRSHIPERDGILSGLMILDMMVKTGKRPSELVQLLFDKVGQHHYHRWDVHFEKAQGPAILERVRRARPSKLGGKKVENVDTRDGFRYVLKGGYWALVRFSGTEPLLRIYAEAESPDQVERLLTEARDIAGV